MKTLKVVMVGILLATCSCSYVKESAREFNGTAAPKTANLAENINVPETKTYRASQAKITDAIKKYLKKEGILFTESKNGKVIQITTEYFVIEKQASLVRSLMAANYDAKLIAEIEGSQVSCSYRFAKYFHDKAAMDPDLKFPDKEKELRAKFFSALDNLLIK